MAAKHALETEKDFLKEWLEKFNRRKIYLLNFFESVKGLKPFYPKGILFICFVRGYINKRDKKTL